MFTFASFMKTTKRYARNPSLGYTKFVNLMLEPYVAASGIEARSGGKFALNDGRISRLMNGKDDVPLSLRKVRLQRNLVERVVAQSKYLFEEVLNPALINYLEEDILSLFDLSDPAQEAVHGRLLAAYEKKIHLGFLAYALISVMGFNNKTAIEESTLWKRGTGKLCWVADDLLRFGFNNRRKEPNLVVIPVDCNFDTHVTRVSEGATIQRIAPSTLHGQWLSRMQKTGVFEREIDERIRIFLQDIGSEGAHGPESHPIGTIVPINVSKAVFLLLAVSRIDADGNAQSTPADIELAIRSLLTYYDKRGQGANLYLPLIGTGMSRAGLSAADSFELIRRCVTEGASFVGGKVTIVVRPTDIDDIQAELTP